MIGRLWLFAIVACMALSASANLQIGYVAALRRYGPALPASMATNLAMHLKSDAGVTVAAGKVATWADQSGNTNNATDRGELSRPMYVADAFMGKPAIRFIMDTNNVVPESMFLPTATALGITNSAYEIFVVARPDSITNRMYLISGGERGPVGTGSAGPYLRLNPGLGFRFAGTNDVTAEWNIDTNLVSDIGSAAQYADNQVHIFSSRIDSGDGFKGIARVDGVDAAASTLDVRNSNTNILYLGAYVTSFAYEFSGDMFEVLLYNRTLTADERAGVEAYLQHRWSTP